MLSLTIAQDLKEAGLKWAPKLHDLFMVPDTELDKRLFVISDVMTYVEIMQGKPAVTFHGALEWALDYVMLADILWLPHEAQLREMLEERLRSERPPILVLISMADGYRCEIRLNNERLAFEAFGASEAYGLALLHLLRVSGA